MANGNGYRMDRRRFLAGSMSTLTAAMLSQWPLEALAAGSGTAHGGDWDPGGLRHLLPTVNDTSMFVKASFQRPQAQAPELRVENRSLGRRVTWGRMNDTSGHFWQFHAGDLSPATAYRLSLHGGDGRPLCEPWQLSTFPSPKTKMKRARILFFTCAGGVGGTYDGIGKRSGALPPAIRNRLLRRGLSFSPDAVVSNGDHIYWDLHTWLGDRPGALSGAGERSNFDFAARVFGTRNEDALRAAAEPQIVPVYGTDFRSTPVFFLQDDHDHWENDSPVSYPVPWFQLQLARATQQLYYPEFLPDSARPRGLPWSATHERGDLSESFGTIRIGDLAEVLLYDVRRTMSVNDVDAVFIDRQAEQWLAGRAAAGDTRHLVHVPSNPPGWTAGKWGEWYPDVLDPARGELTISEPKPHWRQGWLEQHDRIMQALSAMTERAPLVVSGDLHAIGMGEMRGSGHLDFGANPVTAVLSGPIGTSPEGFPSVIRGSRPLPSAVLDLDEAVAPIEQHGFTLVDFTRDRMVIRLFKWDVNSEPLETIDTLEPFYSTELERRA